MPVRQEQRQEQEEQEEQGKQQGFGRSGVSRRQLMSMAGGSVALGAFLAACGISPPDPQRVPLAQQVPRFSRGLLGAEVPDGWRVWTIHPGKTPASRRMFSD